MKWWSINITKNLSRKRKQTGSWIVYLLNIVVEMHNISKIDFHKKWNNRVFKKNKYLELYLANIILSILEGNTRKFGLLIKSRPFWQLSFIFASEERPMRWKSKIADRSVPKLPKMRLWKRKKYDAIRNNIMKLLTKDSIWIKRETYSENVKRKSWTFPKSNDWMNIWIKKVNLRYMNLKICS